jgi:hypothetical protein
MPYGQTFKLQFKPGDVIYGFSSSRNRYVNSLSPDMVKLWASEGHYTFIDWYNVQTFSNPSKDVRATIPRAVRGPVTEEAIKRNLASNRATGQLNPAQKASLTGYYDALQESKFAPLEAVKMEEARVKAKGNYAHEQLVIRRACKFGLQYLIERHNATVHFCLDHPDRFGELLNLGRIVNKAKYYSVDPDTGSVVGYVEYTTSELRCCYRKRHWLATGRLKFYLNLIEVPAPWLSHPDSWAVYEQHRIEKGKV